MRIFFYRSQLIFYLNIVVLSTTNEEVHGGGQVDLSLVAVKNGAITFAHMIFWFQFYHPKNHRMKASCITNTNLVTKHS